MHVIIRLHESFAAVYWYSTGMVRFLSYIYNHNHFSRTLHFFLTTQFGWAFEHKFNNNNATWCRERDVFFLLLCRSSWILFQPKFQPTNMSVYDNYFRNIYTAVSSRSSELKCWHIPAFPKCRASSRWISYKFSGNIFWYDVNGTLCLEISISGSMIENWICSGNENELNAIYSYLSHEWIDKCQVQIISF